MKISIRNFGPISSFDFDLAKDFDSAMEAGLVTTMIPGAVIIPGAFLFNFQIIHAVLLNQASLVVGTGIMMYPLLKWKKSEEKTSAQTDSVHQITDVKLLENRSD